MVYVDGSPVVLGDVVSLPVPGGTETARVVMLGDTYEHLDIDPQFVRWVTAEKKLEPSHIVVEWLERNPFAHNNPAYSPVGNYMFSPVDKWVTRVA
jgi:hypothetical protein